jgi:glycerophosphoryl diester phosphodiesterase
MSMLMIMRMFFACALLAAFQNMKASDTFDLQGHRGTRGLVPENTIAAFLKAVELGVTTLELDVVVTKDSQIVVSHEPWMSDVICRYPDGSEVEPGSMLKTNIFRMTYDEVRSFDCGTRLHQGFPEQVLESAAKPLLSEVFQAVEERLNAAQKSPVFYNIETKSLPQGDGLFHPDPATFCRLLYQLLEEREMLKKVTIQSFDVRTLQKMRELDAEMPLVLLVENDLGLDANLKILGFVPAVYSPNYKLVDLNLVQRVQAMGMKIIPWTVNEPADMLRMFELGVDGLITDYPDRAGQLLKGQK